MTVLKYFCDSCKQSALSVYIFPMFVSVSFSVSLFRVRTLFLSVCVRLSFLPVSSRVDPLKLMEHYIKSKK